MMWICSLLFFAWASSVSATYTINGCTCYGPYDHPPHPQLLFQDADFCIKGNVKSGADTDYSYGTSVTKYSVAVKETFKGNCREGETIEILSMHTGCHVGLEVGKNYLLYGPSGEGKYWINQCGYISLWKDVTPHQRNAINKRYVANQMCAGKCEMDQSIAEICYYRYATCQKKTNYYGDGDCEWVKGIGGGFGKCVKDNTYHGY